MSGDAGGGAPPPEGWFETLSQETRYEGFSDVRVDMIRMPDGSQTQREVVEHDDVVAMVPVLDDGTVLLLRQYRHPVGRYLLEIPAGTLDHDDESPEQAAQRELAEEIEHRAETLTSMITVDVSPGWSTERTEIFLARGLTAVSRPEGFVPADEEADMEVVRLPLDVAAEGARRGELTDAKTVIGLLLAAAHIAH